MNNNKKTIKLIIQRSGETIEFGDFIGEVIEMPTTQVIEEESGVNKSPPGNEVYFKSRLLNSS